jgi:hypothetical protein
VAKSNEKALLFGVDRNTLIFATAAGAATLFVGYKVSQKLGLSDTKGDKDKRQIELGDFWTPSYYENAKIEAASKGKSVTIPNEAKARAICKQIYYANGIFSDADVDALQAINNMPSLAYLSFVCAYWENNFRSMFPLYPSVDNPSLVTYLSFMSDKSWTQLKSILSNKPKY